MPLFALGINHQTAPVALRERVAFAEHALPETLRSLRAMPEVREAALLSTCNRTELYAVADDGGEALARWLALRPDADLSAYLYVHQGGDAARHLFRVASHSKTFTAVAVLRLVATGRLRLDDTVAGRLPDCADTPLARVTVRELLSHTSGAIRDGVDADHWQLDGPFPDADALRAIVRDHGATYAPQERFKYSNIGYGLLGAIIEAVTGRGYAEHVTEDILVPLGLTDTRPEIDDDAAGRAVVGHTRAHGRGRRVTVAPTATGALAAA